MASLRKKPADVAMVVDDDGPAAVATRSETPPAEAQPELTERKPADVLLAQIDALKQAETMQQQAHTAQLVAEERRQAWLTATPAAQENLPALGAFHHAALNAGLADTSPEYFNFMEQQLAALTQRPAAAAHLVKEMQARVPPKEPEPEPRPRHSIVSAPVSREIPSGGDSYRPRGKVTLSQDEREMAKASGITTEEYARQKLRLAQMRESGQYGGDQQR
jgi:hypothetical protein